MNVLDPVNDPDPEHDYIFKELNRYVKKGPWKFKASYQEVVWPVVGVGLAVSYNIYLRRPKLAALHLHVLGLCGGFVLGRTVDEIKYKYFRRRDLAIYDYIQRHREDFEEEPRKLADILEPWKPFR